MRLTALLLSLSFFVVQPAAAPSQSFEAFSIHPLAHGAKPDGEAAFKVLDPSRPDSDPAPSLLSGDVTLYDLLACAFVMRDAGLLPAFEKQLPDWAQADEMHLSARLPAGATVGQMRLMLQTLLRERFAFASHLETKVTPVFLLQTDTKQPLKLTPHAGACTQDAPCGDHTSGVNGAVTVTFTGQTLDEMAQELGGYAWYWAGLRYGPVVNATPLQGRYDGTVTFTPIFKADADTVTTLPYALQHDLGLTLQKGTRPLAHRIIDHVERPTFD